MSFSNKRYGCNMLFWPCIAVMYRVDKRIAHLYCWLLKHPKSFVSSTIGTLKPSRGCTCSTTSAMSPLKGTLAVKARPSCPSAAHRCSLADCSAADLSSSKGLGPNLVIISCSCCVVAAQLQQSGMSMCIDLHHKAHFVMQVHALIVIPSLYLNTEAHRLCQCHAGPTTRQSAAGDAPTWHVTHKP